MSKKIKAFLVILLAVTVFTPVLPARAVDEEATQASDTTTQDASILQSTAPAETSAETETSTPVDRSNGRAERVKAYKEKVQSKLTAVKEKRLTTRCKNAQEKIMALRTRLQTALSNRRKAYQTISEKLDSAVEKLKKAGVDTTKLETARDDIKADIASLDESMNAYDTVLADLEEMDCVADPATFQAALESARETQKSLREQAQQVRTFATTEVKALLEEMKTKLSAQSDATTEQPTEGGDQ